MVSKLKYRRTPQYDYMKYWRVIRRYVKVKYGVRSEELDMMFFLYSEKYFSRDKFNSYEEIFPWNKNRFYTMLNDGWIVIFREKQGNKKALYELSYKAKRMIWSIYNKLNGEAIPENKANNPMFLAGASYSDKVYRNVIKEMNEFIRQQQRQPPE